VGSLSRTGADGGARADGVFAGDRLRCGDDTSAGDDGERGADRTRLVFCRTARVFFFRGASCVRVCLGGAPRIGIGIGIGIGIRVRVGFRILEDGAEEAARSVQAAGARAEARDGAEAGRAEAGRCEADRRKSRLLIEPTSTRRPS
jgi:hypothetical protein